MLAATYTQGVASSFSIQEVATPEIESDEMLLRMRAASICGTDVKIVRSGHRKLQDGQRIVLGHEFVGVIDQVGSRVEGYCVGPAGGQWCPTPVAGSVRPACAARRTTVPPTRPSASIATADTPSWVRIPEPLHHAGQRHGVARGDLRQRGVAAGAILLCRQRRAVVAAGIGRYGRRVRCRSDRADARHVVPRCGCREVDIDRCPSESGWSVRAAWAAMWCSIRCEEDVVARVRQETDGQGANVVITACPAAEVQIAGRPIAGSLWPALSVRRTPQDAPALCRSIRTRSTTAISW